MVKVFNDYDFIYRETTPIHVKFCNKHYLGHNFKHIRLAIFKCDVCNYKIVFA